MAPTEKSTVGILVARLRAEDHRPQSAKADFAIFQRRIHSLLEAVRREVRWVDDRPLLSNEMTDNRLV